MKIQKNILALLIIFLAIFFRFYKFGQIPSSLYWDEAAIGLDARSILETGKDLSGHHWLQPLFYSYGDYKAPVYIWTVALFGKIFGVTELTVRLPCFIASILMSLILYKLAGDSTPGIRRVQNDKRDPSKKSILPLCVVLSFLLMPWSFHFARIGMESHLSLFWLLLMVYLQVLSIKKRKPFLMILAAFSGVLAIYSYIAARVMAAILYIAGLIQLGGNSRGDSIPGIRRVQNDNGLKCAIAFLVGLLILALATIFLIKSPNYAASQNYRLSNDNLVRTTEHIEKSVLAQEFHNRSVLSRIFHHRYRYWLQAYVQNYLIHFSPDFFLFKGDSNLRHHSGFGGEVLFMQGGLLGIGLFYVLSYFLGKALKIPLSPPLLKGEIPLFVKKGSGEILMLIWLVASPLAASLVNNEIPHASRAIYMIIPLAWFIGLGINFLYKKNKLIFSGAILFLIINFTLFLHDYFVHYPARSGIAWLAPYKAAAEYFKNNPSEKQVFVTDQWYQPGLYFAFYGNTKISSLQGSFREFLQKFDKFTFHLPNTCDPDTLCIAPSDWQTGNTEIVSKIPGTEKLVIKRGKFLMIQNYLFRQEAFFFTAVNGAIS